MSVKPYTCSSLEGGSGIGQRRLQVVVYRSSPTPHPQDFITTPPNDCPRETQTSVSPGQKTTKECFRPHTYLCYVPLEWEHQASITRRELAGGERSSPRGDGGGAASPSAKNLRPPEGGGGRAWAAAVPHPGVNERRDRRGR